MNVVAFAVIVAEFRVCALLNTARARRVLSANSMIGRWQTQEKDTMKGNGRWNGRKLQLLYAPGRYQDALHDLVIATCSSGNENSIELLNN